MFSAGLSNGSFSSWTAADHQKTFAASPTVSENGDANTIFESSLDHCFLFTLLCKTLVINNVGFLFFPQRERSEKSPTNLYHGCFLTRCVAIRFPAIDVGAGRPMVLRTLVAALAASCKTPTRLPVPPCVRSGLHRTGAVATHRAYTPAMMIVPVVRSDPMEENDVQRVLRSLG